MRNLSAPFPRQVEQMGEKPMPLMPKLYYFLWNILLPSVMSTIYFENNNNAQEDLFQA